ncbi:DUF4349 domain-containing protein [Microbulbifer sp. YPW16]|uniref:DUF4349 domain-containing protein n=1 Tax=unclassified Microbulbifer TaxID=2619833 RepID=UPI001E28DD50|nr:DUF4349 domain-containing protein [Microbulbifer sp. YPW16]UHQ56185.1 DUF4349 domain-containing protein [Microbulbifer sp. YPW16]
MSNRFLFVLLVLLLASACSRDSSDDSARMAEPAGQSAALKVADIQRQRTKYLAYTHSVSVEYAVDELEERYESLLAWCADDAKYRCTLLDSRLNTSNYVSGRIEVRLLPGGVPALLEVAAGGGTTTGRSTSIEDLGDAIVDNQKRVEMLRDYRARLEGLSERTTDDIEALVKVASELARVQSDLEMAEGKRSRLLQRVEMDRVQIQLLSLSQKSFAQPIAGAFRSFGGQLSEGIADTVTAVAYLLPWMLLGLFLLYLARLVWVRVRRKHH